MDKRKKRIRAILFDKDGTLIDFSSLWIPLAFDLADKLCIQYKLGSKDNAALLECIGIQPDGTILPNSIYVSGTEEDIAQVWYQYFEGSSTCSTGYDSILKYIRCEMKTYMELHKNQIQSVQDAEITLAALRKMGFTLGVSTSDNEENTRVCLKVTGLLKYFQYIGCPSDSKNPKPSGDILIDFSTKFKINPEEIAIVGDTATDIAFAKQNHAGLAIGVLSGAGSKEDFNETADYIFSSIADLVCDSSPIWEMQPENSTDCLSIS